jgi:hypothetical protein
VGLSDFTDMGDHAVIDRSSSLIEAARSRSPPGSSLSLDTLGDERRQPSGRWYDRLPRKPAKP